MGGGGVGKLGQHDPGQGIKEDVGQVRLNLENGQALCSLPEKIEDKIDEASKKEPEGNEATRSVAKVVKEGYGQVAVEAPKKTTG